MLYALTRPRSLSSTEALSRVIPILLYELKFPLKLTARDWSDQDERLFKGIPKSKASKKVELASSTSFARAAVEYCNVTTAFITF